MTLTNNIIYVSKKKEKLKNLGVTPEARQIPFALGGYFEWKRITTRALIDTQKKCQDSKPPAKCPFDLKLVR